jgi:hypothetical protein
MARLPEACKEIDVTRRPIRRADIPRASIELGFVLGRAVSATRKFVSDRRARHGVQGRVTPHHHGVVAKTGFSTWQFLLDPEFMGRGLIWPRCLGVAFAGTWPSCATENSTLHAKLEGCVQPRFMVFSY